MPDSSAPKTSFWISPAVKRHGWHVVLAAGAVMGLYAWKDDPDLILIVATSIFVSGVVAGGIELGRWLYHWIED
jgi:hypothetical protein